jgi:hypothetical protein
VRVSEHDTAGGEAVEDRRLDAAVPVEADGIRAQRVDRHEEDVGARGSRCRSRSADALLTRPTGGRRDEQDEKPGNRDEFPHCVDMLQSCHTFITKKAAGKRIPGGRREEEGS